MYIKTALHRKHIGDAFRGKPLNHKVGCQCGCCKAKRHEPHKEECNCCFCKRVALTKEDREKRAATLRETLKLRPVWMKGRTLDKAHKSNCMCSFCKMKKGLGKGKDCPGYGKHEAHLYREDCKCAACKGRRGEFVGHPVYYSRKRIYFDVPNQGKVCLRSSWEFIYAKYLVAKRVDFRYEHKRFYLDAKSFLPDFYLVKEDRFVEVKGWVSPQFKKIMEEMKVFHPDIKVEIVAKKEIEQINRGRRM